MKESWLEKKGLLKSNYQGVGIPTVGGLILLPGAAVGWLLFFFFGKIEQGLFVRLLSLGVIIGAAGLLDDVAGSKEYQGFKGHFKAARDGRLTTGFFKALTAFLSVLLITPYRGSILVFIIDIFLILFITNLFNLLDLRPGRALKFFLLVTIPLLPDLLFYLLPLYLIIALYLPLELQEKVMLGDTGANFIGVFAGLGFATVFSQPAKIFILVIILTITIFAESRSISEIIASNKLLAWFDQLGRSGY